MINVPVAVTTCCGKQNTCRGCCGAIQRGDNKCPECRHKGLNVLYVNMGFGYGDKDFEEWQAEQAVATGGAEPTAGAEGEGVGEDGRSLLNMASLMGFASLRGWLFGGSAQVVLSQPTLAT